MAQRSSLPLSEEVNSVAAHNFFANLLPEGDFRRKVERQYKVSSHNDYSLIITIGGDCAGALTIAQEDTPSKWAYKKLDDAEIDVISCVPVPILRWIVLWQWRSAGNLIPIRSEKNI